MSVVKTSLQLEYVISIDNLQEKTFSKKPFFQKRTEIATYQDLENEWSNEFRLNTIQPEYVISTKNLQKKNF